MDDRTEEVLNEMKGLLASEKKLKKLVEEEANIMRECMKDIEASFEDSYYEVVLNKMIQSSPYVLKMVEELVKTGRLKKTEEGWYEVTTLGWEEINEFEAIMRFRALYKKDKDKALGLLAGGESLKS